VLHLASAVCVGDQVVNILEYTGEDPREKPGRFPKRAIEAGDCHEGLRGPEPFSEK
jgi:hypothetical protein